MAAHSFLRDDGWFRPVTPNDAGISTSTTTSLLSFLTNSTTANVIMSSTSTFADGPSVTQGSSGIWYASGTVSVVNNSAASANNVVVKLWDGTTPIAVCILVLPISGVIPASLSGIISAPAGNLRISGLEGTVGLTATMRSTSFIDVNASTITAFRIG